MKLWWRICKKQDFNSFLQFDIEWEGLLDILNRSQSSVNARTYINAIAWLQALETRRKQWAARWTWQIRTLGVHSTQRAEAIHSSIKRFLSANTLLTQLASKIEESRNTISDMGEGKSIRLALKNASSTSDYHSVAENLLQIVTPFAFSIVKSQISRCMQYGIEDKHLDKPSESENPIEVYTVKYISGTDSQADIS